MSKNSTYVTIPGMGGNAPMSIDDIIVQVTGGRPVEQQVEEPGFLSQAADTVGAVVTGAPLVARGIAMGWDNLWSGFDPNDVEAREKREVYERDLADYQAKYQESGTVPQWFAEAAGSSGQSLVGTGASLAGMAAGIPGGIPGMAGGAAVAGGVAAARMDYAEVSYQLHKEVTRRMGREPTEAEWQGILADMRPYLLKHAAIEGAGEGVGDAILGFAFKPFSPFVKAAGEAVGRGIGGKVLRGAGALGAGIGSEITTEGLQQWGQGHVEADMFGAEAPTLGEAFSEVAGPTAAQTVMTGGLMGGMRLGLNLLRDRGGNGTGTAEGEQPINMDEPVQPVEDQSAAQEGAEARNAGQPVQTQEEPVSDAVRRQTEWNREHPGMTMRNGKIVPILRAKDLPLEAWQRAVNRGYDSSAAQEGQINPPRDFFGMEGVVSGRARQGSTAIQPADSPAFGMEPVSFANAPMSRRFAESEPIDLLGSDRPVNEVMPQDDAIDVEWRELPAQGLLGARTRSALPAPQARPTSSMAPALRENNGASPSVASGLMGAFMPAVRQAAQPGVMPASSFMVEHAQSVQPPVAGNVTPAASLPGILRPAPQQEARRVASGEPDMNRPESADIGLMGSARRGRKKGMKAEQGHSGSEVVDAADFTTFSEGKKVRTVSGRTTTDIPRYRYLKKPENQNRVLNRWLLENALGSGLIKYKR